MKHSRKPKPSARLEPSRVELVRSTYEPSKAELEESATLAPQSLEEAARRLLEPVEIPHIGKQWSES